MYRLTRIIEANASYIHVNITLKLIYRTLEYLLKINERVTHLSDPSRSNELNLATNIV